MSVLDEARANRDRQRTLTGLLIRELLELWRKLFGLRGPSPEDFDEVLALVRPLIQEYASASGELATDSYLAQRAAAGLPADFIVPEVELPNDAQIEGSLRWVMRPPTEVTRDPHGLDAPDDADHSDSDVDDVRDSSGPARADPSARSDVIDRPIDLDALAGRRETDVSGAARRMVAQTGRLTLERAIDEDPAAVAWARITDANPCAFCAMLASRGFVYLGRDTALYKEGTSDRYHDHDECTVMARFRNDDSPLPPEMQAMQDLWYQTAAFFSGQDAYNAYRRALGAQRSGGDPTAAAFDGPASDPEKYRRLIAHDPATVEAYRKRAQRGGRNGRPPNERDHPADPRFRTP